MITALDTNVLLDILIGEAARVKQSSTALQAATEQGPLVASIVVCAEISSEFEDFFAVERFLQSLRCSVSPIDLHTAHLAGEYFHQYRLRGGDRTRILPDFLIAAHARLQADRLLTRDARFFSDHFDGLAAVHPADLAP